MANITIQNLEVESTALNQVSPGEMEKVIGGFVVPPFISYSSIVNRFLRASNAAVFADLIAGFLVL